MSMFGSQLINGVNNGALIVLAALGMAIIFGIMNVVNLAHGELIMLGAYVTTWVCGSLDLPFAAGVVASMIVTAAVGVVIELVIIKKLYDRPVETMLATFAVAIILREVIRLIFGTTSPQMHLPLSGTVNLGSIVIPMYNLLATLVVVIVIGVTALLLYKTIIGKKIMGITQNRTICEVLGINSSRIDTVTFAYGAGIAGLAGAILAPIKNISPDMGANYLTDSFMAVVIGGVNSLPGAAIGGMLIGFPSTVIGGYISEISAKVLILLLVIVFIRLKPEGLFAKVRR